MLHKFEAVGISVSVVAMALALYMVRLESTPESPLNTAAEQPALVVVSREGNQEDALFRALANSLDANGNVNSLVVDDAVVGEGEDVQKGDTVTVHYVGTLQNGTEFDSSLKRGQPYVFTVGEGQVIPGWDNGIVGMKVGGQRILVVPPSQAYGSRELGGIPANSTLIFSVELLEIS